MVIVKKIAIPGYIINHHASWYCLPRFNKLPHVTTSSGTPIPKNERPLSINIADAIPNAMLTKTGAREFGSACLNIVLVEENPNHKISSIFKEMATKVKESFL